MSAGSQCLLRPAPAGPGDGAAIVLGDAVAGAVPAAGGGVSDQPEPSTPPPAHLPAAGTASGRSPRTRLLAGVAAAVFAVDLVSKLVVVAVLSGRPPLRLLGGAVYLTEARNTGAAFSFAEGATVLFTLIAVVVVIVIVRASRRLFSTGWAVTLGLVLGGAVGNLSDRVFRDPGFLRGGVVDFISLFDPYGRVWPIFNAADSAIVCGGVLGALLAFRGVEFDGSRSRDRDRDAEPGDGAATG
jgi:signal peptidase II